MPPRPHTILVAERVAIDSITGRVTPFNLIPSVAAPSFPSVLPQISVIVFYEGLALDGTVFLEKAQIIGPDNKLIVESTRPSEVRILSPFHVSIHGFTFLPLQMPGSYSVQIQAKQGDRGWETTGARWLSVEAIRTV